MSEGPRVLLVDDEPRILSALQRSLRREPVSVETAGSAAEALAALDRNAREDADPIRLVVSDQKMPGCSGIELIGEIAARHPSVRRILLTGWPESIDEPERVRLGLSALVSKPWDDQELKREIRAALDLV
ncbi:MAG: response regulator [Myxococcota bacterium]|nr:response regulator [Myxococcota bacterium]